MEYKSDNEIVIAYNNNPVYGSMYGYMLSIDTNANELWSAEFSAYPDHLYIQAFERCTDNSITISGYTGYSGEEIVFIANINSTGTLNWKKSYGGIAYAFGAYDIVTSPSGGYLFLVNNRKQLVKINNAGEFLWQEMLGNYNESGTFGNTLKRSVNDYVFFGYYNIPDHSEPLPILIKFSEQ